MILLFSAAASAVLTALVQSAAPAMPPITPAASDQTRYPTAEFPERALSRGIEAGDVVLSCGIVQTGGLEDCTVLSEDPGGMGFGQAALAGVRRAHVSPETVSKAGEGARVTFTVRFRLPDEDGSVPGAPSSAEIQP